MHNCNIKLNKIQRELIIGTLLGDGCMKTSTKGRTWSYRSIHKISHKEYLLHKYEILKVLCKSEPKLSKVFDKRTFKIYERYYFNTLVSSSLRFYGNLFYKFDNVNNKFIKQIPKNIGKFLTPRAIAYWYMDDGSLKWLGKSNAMRICTECFDLDSIKRLQNILNLKYDIKVNIIKKKKNNIIVGYRLSINEANSVKFRELIKPYLLPFMFYKVSDGLKGHL